MDEVLLFLLAYLRSILGSLCILFAAGLLYFVFKPRQKNSRSDSFLDLRDTNDLNFRTKSTNSFKISSVKAVRVGKKREINTFSHPNLPQTKALSNKNTNPSVAVEFCSTKDVRNKIIYFLSKREPKGAEFKRIKRYCEACFPDFLVNEYTFDVFDNKFQEAFDFLRNRYALSYNKKLQIWVFNSKNYKEIELHSLTDKEKRYFAVKKLGLGWFRLGDKSHAMDAVWWIHQNLNPEEFESFCCAFLAHHQVKDVRVSEKRESGADDGIDGLGNYNLNGKMVQVAIQAKKYRPNRQVTTNEVRDFLGALVEEDIDYGFFITTAIFSERAIDRARSTTNNVRNNIEFQFLDQSDIIECLLYKADSPHGYGLHCTDDLSLYYINPDMLRRSIQDY